MEILNGQPQDGPEGQVVPAAPLVVAYPLEEARSILEGAGWTLEAVDVTRAPGRRGAGFDAAMPAGGELLVVRQRAVGSRAVRLAAAYHPGHPDDTALTGNRGAGHGEA